MNFSLAQVDLDLVHAHVSNSIATVEDLNFILNAWKNYQFYGDDEAGKWLLNITPAQTLVLLQHMLIEFADNGTSMQTKYDAVFGHDTIEVIPEGFTVSLNLLVSIIKRFCTVRQFASYYAPMYWNWSITNECPPAKWAKFGFKESEKYAGFDFFYGVTDAASMDGPYKPSLVRQPFENEIIASQANSRVSIYRDVTNRDQGPRSTFVEVTKGSAVPRNMQLGLLPPPT